MEREKDVGNVEYKLKVVGKDEKRIDELATQMKFRLIEGGGEALYEIGVSNDGQLIGLNDTERRETLENLSKAAERIGAKCTIIREADGKKGKIVEVLVRRIKEDYPIYLTVPLLGNVDSGKSTIVGVLCSGELDDGNGLAMSKIARYIHEIKMRRTSSISSHLLGYDEQGSVTNYSLVSPMSESEIYLNSAKIISFVDLGGHEKYLKTTLKGVMGHIPDYVMLSVGANMGVIGTTKEHLGVSLALKIPLFIVVTKIDMVPKSLVEGVLEDVQFLLKMPGINKIPIIIKDFDDVVAASKHMPSGRIVPIFLISNKTGEGLILLRTFLNLLPPRLRWDESLKKPFKMYIDDKFDVKGVGTVVSGIALQGGVSVDDIVQVGPFYDGSFRSCRIKSMHVNRVSVRKVLAGQDATFALANIGFEEIKKGMVLLDKQLIPRAVRSFEAKVLILYHPTTIREGYHSVIHLHTIRETAEITRSSKKVLRTGDEGIVEFMFLYNPQFIETGQTFVFREGRTKGIGRVLKIIE